MDAHDHPSPDAVRLQLSRIEASSEFAGSARLVSFLRYVVEETLSNGGVSLKEVVIGNAVYERDPPYDSRIDSTVRVEARRLRRKLRDYYRGTGANDPVLVDLPTGGYVPTFSVRCVTRATPADSGAREAIFRSGNGAAVAIMPFRAISRDPDLDTFADGLTDELIYTMGKADGLWIASRGTVLPYKGQERSPVELAALLGVDAVLQGSVRHEGRLLRVTVEVSDVEGFVVWSDRFDVPDDERLHLQEKIARTLLSRARFDSSPMREMRIGPGPVALRANAKVYRARLLLDQQTPDSIAAARRLFAQVAERAPDYARGHSGIADCLCDLFRLGVITRDEALAPALSAVRTALAIDSESIEANVAMATIRAWLQRDPPAAEAAFEAARTCGVSARANRLHGVFLSLFGEHDKAARLFREAREIEPFSKQQDIAEAMSHYHARRFDALTSNATAERLAGQPAEALVFVALAHVFDGKGDALRRWTGEIREQCNDTPEYALTDAELDAWCGRPERGRALTAADLAKATCFARATLAAALGDERHMFDELEAALDRGELSTAWMRSDIRFDAWRNTPSFRRLLQRLQPLHVSEHSSP